MNFIELDLEIILSHLNKLEPTSKPIWGEMSAQQMVEHLTDSIIMSISEEENTLLIPEDKINQQIELLISDKPLPQNFKSPLFKPGLRHEELELAIDELVEAWLAYEEFFELHPNHEKIHPFYGKLDKKANDRFHSKHFTHHFKQFNLI